MLNTKIERWPSQLRASHKTRILIAHLHAQSRHTRYLAAWLNGGEYEGTKQKKNLSSVVVVSLGVADHVHGRGGAWPHINKKRGIVRIEGGCFQAEVRGEDSGMQAQPLGLIFKTLLYRVGNVVDV